MGGRDSPPQPSGSAPRTLSCSTDWRRDGEAAVDYLSVDDLMDIADGILNEVLIRDAGKLDGPDIATWIKDDLIGAARP